MKSHNTYFVLFSLLFVTDILTQNIPFGEYERISVDGKEIIVHKLLN